MHQPIDTNHAKSFHLGPIHTRSLSQLRHWLRRWRADRGRNDGRKLEGGIRHAGLRRRASGGSIGRINAAFPLAATVGLALAGCQQPAIAAENYFEAPAPTRIAKEPVGLKVAVFAGGCFWGVEGVFSHVKGVKRAVSGYHGGNAATANYKATNSGVTGHAEAVRIVYDPKVVRYDELLQIFFSVVADPTLKNRQGPDRGSQYRAAIVPMSKEQRATAAAYLAQMEKSGKWTRPIVTKIESYRKFYPAESYHQDFMVRNPRHGYIVHWDKPKVSALKRFFPEQYRSAFLRDHK